MAGLGLVKIAQGQALHESYEQAVQVPVQLGVHVGLDDGQPVTCKRRKTKKQDQADEGKDQLAEVMRNQGVVDQEPDGQRQADLETHGHQDRQAEQQMQFPVGSQVDPDGLVQEVPDFAELVHENDPGCRGGGPRRSRPLIACSRSVAPWTGGGQDGARQKGRRGQKS